ncbi:MAG: cytochrome c [Pseudomonadota bacterium]
MSKRESGLLGVLLVSATCGLALAQTPPAAAPPGPTPAERAIEYRQAVYKIVAGNFGPLAQVAQGKADFRPDVARRQATRLAQIATFVGDSYPDISKEGKTRALPVIWTDRAEFDRLVADFGAHTRKLAEVVEKGEAGADFQAAVTAVGGDCKSCHEKFRSK